MQVPEDRTDVDRRPEQVVFLDRDAEVDVVGETDFGSRPPTPDAVAFRRREIVAAPKGPGSQPVQGQQRTADFHVDARHCDLGAVDKQLVARTETVVQALLAIADVGNVDVAPEIEVFPQGLESECQLVKLVVAGVAEVVPGKQAEGPAQVVVENPVSQSQVGTQRGLVVQQHSQVGEKQAPLRILDQRDQSLQGGESFGVSHPRSRVMSDTDSCDVVVSRVDRPVQFGKSVGQFAGSTLGPRQCQDDGQGSDQVWRAL